MAQVTGSVSAPHPPTTLDEVLASERDLWGEAALLDPDGPSYDSLADLLPPLRYVDATFRHYPIVMCPPGAERKARLVSNGSAINAKAELRKWKDFGYPVTFRVGRDGEVFGHDLDRLDGPRYVEGYLPIVLNRYRHDGAVYEQEVFASCEPGFAEHAVVFVRFTLVGGSRGRVSAHIRVWGPLERSNDRVADPDGQVYLWLDPNWTPVTVPQNRHVVHLAPGQSVFLAVFSESKALEPSARLTPAVYEEQRAACLRRWMTLLQRGFQLDVPERRVADAWRALIVGTFACAKGDSLNYSAGNAYERQYVAECGDAVRALLLYGFRDEARGMLRPLLEHVESVPGKKISFHNTGFRLQLLAHYFWLTGDDDFILTHRERWRQDAESILQHREDATGLLPRENYAGDIFDQVYSLNTNSCCWRGLRDLAAVLREIGQEDAERFDREAAEFRRAILSAVAKSERRDVDPPFIPNALLGEEEPYGAITESEMGSYWNLIMPYVLGSGVFAPDSDQPGWILDYLHRRGGVCMGMTRIDLHSGLFASDSGLDDLYGLRYTLALLARDDVERALTSFYGKLAHGLTRDTYIGAECTSLIPVDRHGRAMGLPPNTASNAFFLWTLRYLLVQDWDTDDDGVPDTLRLLPATPRGWLREDGVIRLSRAPTAFGEVSLHAKSALSSGQVVVEVTAPPRPPKRLLVRARLPRGVRVVAARLGEKQVPVGDDGTVDLSGERGTFEVRFLTRAESAGQRRDVPSGPADTKLEDGDHR